MLDQYSSFFVASSGSAAAFIGLLFVALTIANQGQPDREVVTRRESLAASAFALLLAASSWRSLDWLETWTASPPP